MNQVYNMSGNVWEWTSTLAYNYNYSYYYCGGCYSDPASSINVSSGDFQLTSSNYSRKSIGIRLALSLK